MAQTQAILDAILPRDLATIAHDYLRGSTPREDGFYGHYELAMLTSYSYDALLGACLGGHIAIAEKLIARSCIDAADLSNPFDRACRGGHLDIVKLLVSRGAIYLDNGLRLASCFRHHDIVEYLEGLGATMIH